MKQLSSLSVHNDLRKRLSSYQSSYHLLSKHSKSPIQKLPRQVQLSACTSSSNKAVDLLFQIAKQAGSRGDINTSIKIYQKLLAIDSSHYGATLNLGVSLMYKKQLNLALQHFNKAKILDTENFDPYYNSCLVYFQLRKYSEVVEQINQACKILKNPPNEVTSIRAQGLYRAGKIHTALRDDLNQELIKSPSKQSFQNSKQKSKEKRLVQFRKQRKQKNLIDYPHRISMFKQVKNIEPVLLNQLSFKGKPLNTPSSQKAIPKSVVQNRKKRQIVQRSPELKVFDTTFYGKIHINRLKKKLPYYTEQTNTSFQRNSVHLFDDHLTQVNKSLESLRQSIQQDRKNKVEVSIDEIENQIISIQQLEYFQSQYNQSDQNRNYVQLAKIAFKLKFFKKFPFEVTTKILKIASLKSYSASQIIFSQGDYGQNMYIVVKGSARIEKFSPQYGNNPIVVNSVYDGGHFGELALIKSRESSKLNIRAATCIAIQPSLMLEIIKTQYHQILISELHQDIDQKISFLLQVSLFKDLDELSIVPLASIITKRTYLHNEPLIKKGEIPQGLFIILKGHAVAYTQGLSVKQAHPQFSNIRLRKPQPKPFYTGNLTPIRQDKSVKLRKSFQHLKQDQKQMKKFLSQKEIRKIKDKAAVLTAEKVPFCTLRKGDYFGGRVLRQGDYDNENKTTFRIFPAKFSIIVQSMEAEVYLITKSHINYLSSRVLASLKQKLQHSYQIDCPKDIDSDEMEKICNYWKNLRYELVDYNRRQAYVNRRKPEFPFLRY